MAPAYRPPSSIATFGISVAHGVVMGIVVPMLDGLIRAAYLGERVSLLVILATLIAAFSLLIVVFPFGRVLAFACVLSPAISMTVGAVIDHWQGRVTPELRFRDEIYLGLAISPFLMLIYAVVGWITVWSTRQAWIFGKRDKSRCGTCGYSLVDLKVARCPECGTPVQQTPRA